MAISQAKPRDRESEMYNQYWPILSLLLPFPSSYACAAHHPNQPCPTVMPQTTITVLMLQRQATYVQAKYTVQLHGE